MDFWTPAALALWKIKCEKCVYIPATKALVSVTQKQLGVFGLAQDEFTVVKRLISNQSPITPAVHSRHRSYVLHQLKP